MTYRKAPSFPIFLKLNESLFFPLQVAKFQSFIIAYSGKCYIEGPLNFLAETLTMANYFVFTYFGSRQTLEYAYVFAYFTLGIDISICSLCLLSR